MKANELTNLASDWLCSEYPDATIVTELSVADWGQARIDIAAITDQEIVGVEVKGDGDSPTRLDLQGLVYGKVARKMWLLPSPEGTLAERCLKKKPNGWGALEAFDGAVRPVNRARKLGPEVKTDYGTSRGWVPDHETYRPDRAFECIHQCPWAMCGTLWRDELYEIARLHGVQVKGRAQVRSLTDAICEQMPVPKIHDAMIVELRRRVWRKPVLELRGRKQPVMAGLFDGQGKD